MERLRQVVLMYLAEPTLGGWVTFTAHLWEGFRRAGYAPVLYRLSGSDELKPRPYFNGVTYRNATADYLTALARNQNGACILTACSPRSWGTAAQILRAGAQIVVHDPTEIKSAEARSVVRSFPSSCVVIRKANAINLRSLGVNARFIPHPYARAVARGNQTRTVKGVSVSRIDWDKHTEIVASANELLPIGARVQIYGAENRLYTHHKLDKLHSRWRENFHGAFPKTMDSAVALARSAEYVVDMSAISGDGGGTQYTFLEAWDAGATLIVNALWNVGREADTVKPGENVLSARDGPALARLLSVKGPVESISNAGAAVLQTHTAEVIARMFADGWASA